jgi:tetratricopeptide (TPR) repeat protein
MRHATAELAGGLLGKRELRERAQELIDRAWEAAGPDRARLAREALDTYPECAEAYSILAEESATTEQKRELYSKAMAAGKRALGQKGLDEYAGRLWEEPETRSYMRARAGLAAALWELGEREEALAHLRGMLRLDPLDEPGLRYRFLGWLFLDGRNAEVENLLERQGFAGDTSAVWAYGRTLLAFRREGASQRAAALLAAAHRTGPSVPAELLAAWRGTSGALAWLEGSEPYGAITS